MGGPEWAFIGLMLMCLASVIAAYQEGLRVGKERAKIGVMYRAVQGWYDGKYAFNMYPFETEIKKYDERFPDEPVVENSAPISSVPDNVVDMWKQVK